MKKTPYIAIAAAALMAVSCGEKEFDNPYDRESSISIVASDILFGEDGGTGTVEVKCDKEWSYECKSSWITLERNGSKTLDVTAEANTKMNGRSATIYLICGADTVKAVAQQIAFDFDRDIPSKIAGDDKAGSYTYTYRAPYTVDITSTQKWIKATIEKDKLNITLTENTTGVARLGKIYLRGPEADDPVDSIFISQYDFDGKICGKYDLTHTYREAIPDSDDYNKITLVEDATISQENGTIYLNLACGYSVPMTFDPTAMTLYIDCLSYCGTEKNGKSTYYIYTAFADSTHGIMICGAGFGMFAYITTLGGKVYLKFQDNGEWSKHVEEYSCDTLYLYRFTGTPSYEHSAGSMEQYMNLTMIKQ